MAKLWFRYGAMGSSKTAQAIMTWYNYRERGKKCLLAKSDVDSRDGKTIIKSRIGLEAEAILMSQLCKMSKEELIKFDAIVVDEVQFCSKREIEFLVKIVDDYNITVLCYGLRTSSTNKLFEGAYWLFAWANEIEEIKSVCWCGDGATHNARIDENGNIIKEGPMVVLGGNDTYVSLCRKHYNQNMTKGYVKVKD